MDEFKDDDAGRGGYSGLDSPSTAKRTQQPPRPVSSASNGSAGGLQQQQKKKPASRKPIDLGAAANYAKTASATTAAQPAVAPATASSGGGNQLLDDLFSSAPAPQQQPPRTTSALSGNLEDDDFDPRGGGGGGGGPSNANADAFGNFAGKSGNDFADFSSAFGNGNGNGNVAAPPSTVTDNSADLFGSLPVANAAPAPSSGGIDLFGVGAPAAPVGGGSSNIDLLGGISMPQASTLTAAPGED